MSISRVGCFIIGGAVAISAGNATAITFKVQDTEVGISGYARMNMTYDIDQDLGGANAVGFDLDTEGDGTGPDWDMSAAQSRIGFSTATPLQRGTLKTFIEGDFLASGNFRLRHAYGSWNGILAGQTWANSSLFLGRTPTLDFPSLVGYPGHVNEARQAQVRYTRGGLSLAVEDPTSDVHGAGSGGRLLLDQNNTDTMPDLTARYENTSSRFQYGGSLVLRRLTVDDGTNSDSTFAYGLAGAWRVTITDRTSIQGGVNYGDGLGAYLYRSGAPGAYLDGLGDVNSIAGYGGAVGLSHQLTPEVAFNASHGFAKVDYDDARDDLGAATVADMDEYRSTTFINVLWTPVPRIMFGAELGVVSIEKVDGDDATANRLMLAAQYSF